MEFIAILLLILIGLTLVLLEIFLLPGLVVGLIGFAMLSTGLLWSYSLYGSLYGNLILGGSLGLFILIGIRAFRSKIWRKVQLTEEIKGPVNPANSALREGEQGEAMTRLAPIGIVSVNGVEMEAKSQKGFIDPGSPIVIIKVSESQIIVKQIPQ